jgi:hypothetical protein
LDLSVDAHDAVVSESHPVSEDLGVGWGM